MAGVTVRENGGLTHTGMTGEGAFDLGRLDAEAAHLDLAVRAPDDLQALIRAPRPMSPVRYILLPGTVLYGFGRNRSAVRSGLPR